MQERNALRFLEALGHVDHRFRAAARKSEDREFVGHPFREAESVAESVRKGAVAFQASAADSGTEAGGVDGDDDPGAGGAVVAHDHLLASPLGQSPVDARGTAADDHAKY